MPDCGSNNINDIQVGAAATNICSRIIVIYDAVWDTRLREARVRYESVYEWRIVLYGMHTQPRLDAHDSGNIF